MEWNEYRKIAMKYRIENRDVYEYISILLLGIAEEVFEYRHSVYSCSSTEEQISEYGDLLWNVAELDNIMEEHFPEMDNRSAGTLDVTLTCVQAVRKHYMRDSVKNSLVNSAQAVLTACLVFYAHSGLANKAIISNVAKMEKRHGK